jgi:hypothetical protein
VLLLIGADLTKAKSGWDCGACGFDTCAEFNKYRKLNYGMGLSSFGPSCMLNVLDFGIACDYASAAASKFDIENRIHMSVGLVALYLAYLEDVSSVLGLSLGPLKEFWYYNRPVFTRKWDKEFNKSFWINLHRTLFPVMWQSFSGNAHPYIKTYDRWWEEETQDYVVVYPEPDINRKRAELVSKVMEIVPEKRAKVEEIKERMRKESGS